MFVNTLTFNDKNPRQNREGFPQQIQLQLPRKQKTFSRSFIAFLKSTSNFKYFQKKKMSLIAEGFPKLLTPNGGAT